MFHCFFQIILIVLLLILWCDRISEKQQKTVNMWQIVYFPWSFHQKKFIMFTFILKLASVHWVFLKFMLITMFIDRFNVVNLNSFVDTNTLYLVPDPQNCLNSDPELSCLLWLHYQFGSGTKLLVMVKLSFSRKNSYQYFFTSKIMAREENSELRRWYFVSPVHGSLFLFLIAWNWICIQNMDPDQTQQLAEYGSNLDPDSQHGLKLTSLIV